MWQPAVRARQLAAEKHRAVEILAENEDATADLYAAYAECYPEHRAFWLRLVQEEHLHALWVRQMLDRVHSGEIDIREDRFTPETYQAFLDYLHRRLRETQSQSPTLLEALTIARDLESSMIEQVFFQVFEGDAPALQQMLRNLHASTQAHLAQIAQLWRQVYDAEHPANLPRKTER